MLVIDTPDGIRAYRLLALRAALGLEVKGLVDGADTGRSTLMGVPIGPDSLIEQIGPDAVIVCVEEMPSAKLSSLADRGMKLYNLV